MKNLLLLLSIVWFTSSLTAQDTEKKFYKNQFGYDLRSSIVLLSGGNNDLYEFDFLYRRALTQKDWLTVNLVVRNNENFFTAYDVGVMQDTLTYANTLNSNYNHQLKLNYARHVKILKGDFYFGISLLYMYIQGNSFNRVYSPGTTATTPLSQLLSTNTIENDYHKIGVSPSVAYELPIQPRWSLFINAELFYTRSLGNWNYFGENEILQTRSLNEPEWLISPLIRDISLMYKF